MLPPPSSGVGHGLPAMMLPPPSSGVGQGLPAMMLPPPSSGVGQGLPAMMLPPPSSGVGQGLPAMMLPPPSSGVGHGFPKDGLNDHAPSGPAVPAPTIRAKTNTVKMVAQKTVILRFIDSSFENDNSNSSGLSTLGDNALRITPY